MVYILQNILFIAFAYLLGSISSAILVCKIFNLPDPRTEGSNNPGATNVLRIAGRLPAIITLCGDALKGLLPVLMAKVWGCSVVVIAGVMLAAFLGHVYPIFFKFRGGKGVATMMGVLCGLAWPLGLCNGLIWLVVVAVSRFSSLGAIISGIAAPAVSFWLLAEWRYSLVIGLIALILIWRHRGNIKRLLHKSESTVY